MPLQFGVFTPGAIRIFKMAPFASIIFEAAGMAGIKIITPVFLDRRADLWPGTRALGSTLKLR